MKKTILAILLLLTPLLANAQTTVNGRVMTGTLATRPASCSIGDQFNTTDGNGAYLCNPTPNTWQPIGGGGTFNQTIEQASIPLTQRPILNFTNYVTCVDNPGNISTDCTPNLMVSAGPSHAAGLAGDPGPTLHSPHYVWTEAAQFEPPAAGTATLPNPVTSGDLANTAFPWDLGGDIITHVNPYNDVRAYGARSINPFVAPATTGITATINSASSTATLSSASTFQDGDGVVIYGAGAANGLGTPAAPTVTAAAPNGPTGTGLVVAYTWGATSYSYKVAWRTVGQGMTAASTEGTIANGAATLGPQSNTLVGCTRTTQQVTCQTTAPHQLNVGEAVFISATSDNVNFGGDQKVDGVSDSTHFTFTNGLTVTNGATTSSTGGTIMYYNCNHLALTPPTGAPWQAYIYGRTSGTWNLIGVSEIVNSANAGDVTYMTFDDYGSTMGAAPLLPYFVPSTAPGSATNDSLVTSISSGAGTTTLTLADVAGNSVSGSPILFDDAPAIVAAIVAARVGGGQVVIPAIASGNNSFVTNSVTNIPYSGLPVELIQKGTLTLGDTVSIRRTPWRGEGSSLAGGASATTEATKVQVNRGNPGFYFHDVGLVRLEGLTFNGNGNAYHSVVLDEGGAVPVGVIRNVNFLGLDSSDYMGIGVVQQCVYPQGCTGMAYEHVTFSAGGPQVEGSSATPIFLSKNVGGVKMADFELTRRGLAFKAPGSGMHITLDTPEGDVEGPIMPAISVFGSINTFAEMDIRGIAIDTSVHPILANYQRIDILTLGINAGPVSYPAISGSPIFAIQANIGAGRFANLGQNFAIVAPGSFDGNTFQNQNLLVAPAASIYTPVLTAPASAPTCATVTAGPPYTQAGSWTYSYAAVYPPSNGIGKVSPSSTSCTSDGTSQQITTTIPSSVPNAIGYVIYANGAQSGCATPNTTTLSFTWTGARCGQPPPNPPSGGSAGIQAGNVWANISILTPTTAPTGAANQTKFYMDSTTNWPNFKPNGNTAYSLLGATAGAHSIGAVPCAADTTTGATTWCNTGAAGGIALSVQYNNGAGGLAGAPVPTAPLNVAQMFVSMPTSGGSQPGGFALPGVASRGASGVTDTILASDRAQQVVYSNGAPIAVSIPDPNTSDFNNWVMLTYVSGAGTPTFTPTGVALINGAATYAQTPGTQCKWTTPDNVNYLVTCPGAASLTTTGSPVAGNLTKFASSSQVTNGDLTGDATTSGTMTTTVGQLHFGATAFPLDTSAPTDQQLLFNNAGTISATGAIPSATLATTQSANDNTRKLATTAYVDSAIGGVNALGQNTVSNLFLSDNFCGGLSAEGTVGSLGWFTDFAGAATFQRDSNTSPDINHPCGISINSGSTSGQDVAAYLQYCGSNTASASCSNAPTGTAGNIIAANAAGVFDSTWVIKLPSIASMRFAAGFQDWAAGTFLNPATAKNVIQVRFDTAVPDSSIVFVACDATPTCTTSTTNSISPVAGDWIKIRIRSAVAGTIRYSICQNAGTGGCSLGTETTINTNVPTTLMVPSIGIGTHTSAAKALVFNFFSIQQALTR